MDVSERESDFRLAEFNGCKGSTEAGHSGTQNDKTLIFFDDLISKINDGFIPNKFEFTVSEKDEHGNVVDVIYKGVRFMVGNGYLAWSCTVPPENNDKTYDMIRFSEWLESMRKDVEYFLE